MAKSVIINGVTYEGVPYVNIPLSAGSGNAKFVDTDSADAVASDLRNGKKAFVKGVEITGNKPVKSSSDVTASGKTVTVPAGIYDTAVTKSVADGSVAPTATVTGDEIGTTVTDYEITVTPGATVNAGYVSGNKTGTAVKKYIQVEEMTATPSTSAQTINPPAGKLLSRCNIKAVVVGGDAQPSDVRAGVKFLSAGSLTEKVGTATTPSVAQDSSTKVLTIS